MLCVIASAGLRAQNRKDAWTFTVLHSFDLTDGANPLAPLVQATDGNLYGTSSGGDYGITCVDYCGTVFKITPAGLLRNLYSFGVGDGAMPFGGLVQVNSGSFYGTTSIGGNNDLGTAFNITSTGTLATVHSFDGTDGQSPVSGLVSGTDGELYGTTDGGGAHGSGTVFKITPNGIATILHSFCSGGHCSDGAGPTAGLVQGSDGNFYGTTVNGGLGGNYGTAFRITPSGALTTLYDFCSRTNCSDGNFPIAGLIQATDGNFYGTTSEGGTGTACASRGCGTVFKVTPGGAFTTLYSFNFTDGYAPVGALVQGSDGNLYGTTYEGGAHGGGTIFRISLGGALTTLYSFCTQSGCTDGEGPSAALVQDTNGSFYGTTNAGGANDACYLGTGCGVVFSLSVGLGPFVGIQTTSGRVGTPVKILGTNLTGATSVTFNGTSATFKVVSASLITTTVPVGATTGKVQVITSGNTLTSNVPFRVRP